MLPFSRRIKSRDTVYSVLVQLVLISSTSRGIIPKRMENIIGDASTSSDRGRGSIFAENEQQCTGRKPFAATGLCSATRALIASISYISVGSQSVIWTWRSPRANALLLRFIRRARKLLFCCSFFFLSFSLSRSFDTGPYLCESRWLAFQRMFRNDLRTIDRTRAYPCFAIFFSFFSFFFFAKRVIIAARVYRMEGYAAILRTKRGRLRDGRRRGWDVYCRAVLLHPARLLLATLICVPRYKPGLRWVWKIYENVAPGAFRGASNLSTLIVVKLKLHRV